MSIVQCEPQAKSGNRNLSGTLLDSQIVYSIGHIQGGESAQAMKISILTLTLQVAVAVASDLILSILPIYCLWKSQVSLRIKAAVCGLMSLGGL